MGGVRYRHMAVYSHSIEIRHGRRDEAGASSVEKKRGGGHSSPACPPFMHDVYTITATTSREVLSNRRSTSQIRRTCDIAVSRDQMIFSDYINAMSESGKLQFSRSNNDIRYQKQNAHTTFKNQRLVSQSNTRNLPLPPSSIPTLAGEP